MAAGWPSPLIGAHIDGIMIHSFDGVTSPDVGISGIVAVPEPGTSILLGLGLGVMSWRRRRASLAH